MQKEIKKYLSEIGRKGGKKSKRTLTRKQSLAMIKAREEGRARKEECPGTANNSGRDAMPLDIFEGVQ
jgi:general stress protein YciG